MTEETPPTEKKTAPKKKFEYKQVSQSMSAMEMDALGKEGWELVQTLKDKTSRTFIFKREL